MISNTLGRRAFIDGMAAIGVVACCPRLMSSGKEALDENLVALISDLHVNGRGDEFPDHRHAEKCLRKAVEGILALRPRPAQVVCLGDIAYFWGLPEDYRLAATILAPLESAGMKIAFAMGNHDRRDNFLAQWPEYAKTSPVPGRIVSRVSTPHADLILLDTVNAQPVAFKGKTFPGEIDNAQREWLEAELARTTKPLFVCAHHGMKEDAVRLSKTLLSAKACKGYIHGHWHRWLPQFDFVRLNRLLSTVCLPSTGHWGDIGFATLRTFSDRAVLALHQTDFFGIKGPGDGHPNRDFILKDRAGAVMTFSLA